MSLINYKRLLVAWILFSVLSCAPPPNGGDASLLGTIGPFMPFILIIVLFYFLIIRPQNKQQNERDDMLKSLKKGQEIITNGGILGRIIDILDDDILVIEISKGVNIKIKRDFVNTPIEENKK